MNPIPSTPHFEAKAIRDEWVVWHPDYAGILLPGAKHTKSPAKGVLTFPMSRAEAFRWAARLNEMATKP